jgi:TolA-binding protein
MKAHQLQLQIEQIEDKIERLKIQKEFYEKLIKRDQRE